MFLNIKNAIIELQKGNPILIYDEFKEGECDIIYFAGNITDKNISFMLNKCRGLIYVGITSYIAQKLNLKFQDRRNHPNNDGAFFTTSVDSVSVGSGISAIDRAETIRCIANDQSTPNTFKTPGHIFPIIAKDGGLLERIGHTEAGVDLMKISGLYPCFAGCEILNEAGDPIKGDDVIKFAKEFQYYMIKIEDIKNAL